MGKAGEEPPLPYSVASGDAEQNVEASCGCRCYRIRKFVGLRCIFVLLLSAAVFLSALFWLPPFLGYADQKDLHSDSKYKGHDIVASFIVKKPVSVLQDNILQLADDIFGEIFVPSTKVVILSLDPLSASNMTKVEFAVDSDSKYSKMSSAAASLIRSSFESLVIHQSFLRLTPSLFGNPFSFDVLRFKGGITIIPQQHAFLLQKWQALFNFTLNFSIDEIQSNFDELTSQLKSGLHLASYENLYISLSNSEGSTVFAPTIIQSFVVLAIGNPPSKERLKQLAETITGSHSRNLGLNHTEFGRVKQVRLSSILQHSLNGGGGSGTAWSPSPAPLPHPHHHHHHHHHHHRHHHHHHNAHLAPSASPTEAPATGKGATPPERSSSQAEPPNCHFEHRKRSSQNTGKHSHSSPAVAPSMARHYPVASPKKQVEPPAHVYHSVPALSPLPNVAFAHAEPPPKTEPAAERSNTLSHGPSSSPSSAGTLGTVNWTTLIVIVLCVTWIRMD
ncbi:inactive histone-lysine N-methyltransferase 2E-like isoform X2 [Senna tora]|uniref:Inactive histone-lysine N-methyltransferase 2E-like isoform X2 n=1 Tax=Senna tora TaxID=362788 RepID=A0A834TDV5_9FABA|nr:inactive histone-lysine N-methyltransferase 2E-like isoform X2 [Senna tora]